MTRNVRKRTAARSGKNPRRQWAVWQEEEGGFAGMLHRTKGGDEIGQSEKRRVRRMRDGK